MTMSKERKTALVKEFARQENDTGSPEVQIAICSERIGELTQHLKLHPKDFHSRRGLIAIVNRRNKLLKYLRSVDINRYRTIVNRLGIRGKE